MFYRAIVVLIFATAAGITLASFPGPLFTDRALFSSERGLSEMDHDAQMMELRQRAHAAMVALQSRQQALSCARDSDTNQRTCDGTGSNTFASAKVDF
jgi:hypothetical protein